MGELFQNNHHKWGQSPDFAVRWFEIDPAYQIMRVFEWVGAIDMTGAQKSRWAPAKTARKALAPVVAHVLPLPAPPQDAE